MRVKTKYGSFKGACILQVGAGGTGSYLCEYISQLMYSKKEDSLPIKYCIADGDIVEPSNLSRQKFIPTDLGRYKSAVLAERYGNAHGLNIGFSTQYLEEAEKIYDMFKYYLDNSIYYSYLWILVSCVDNNRSRQIFHEVFNRCRNILYIDGGNEEWVGQVVAGLKLDDEVLLPPVGEVYSDVLNDTDTVFKTQESCAQQAVHSPQNVATNILSALSIFSIINTLINEGHIFTGHIQFNSKVGYARPDILDDFEG